MRTSGYKGWLLPEYGNSMTYDMGSWRQQQCNADQHLHKHWIASSLRSSQ